MTAAESRCLVDTNVLIRFADPADPLHPVARAAVSRARTEYRLGVAMQNLVECWNVMTRPRNRNGFGQSIELAHQHLRWIEELFPRLEEPADVYPRWRELVVSCAVRGVQVHDARLVALMLALGIPKILTFNGPDFTRYAHLGIGVVTPVLS